MAAFWLVLGAVPCLSAGENELTEAEARAGWLLLFDGRTTDGWMSIRGERLPNSHVQQESLNPHPCNYMLVHERAWDDFVLSLEFKISPRCNSGIFIRTWPLTPRPGKDVGFNGIEVAVDDTTGTGFHDTGALYDLVRPEQNAMKPAGQWNKAVITCSDGSIQVELNGQRVTWADLNEWTEPNKRPDGSAHKFDVAYRDHPRKGYIGLQDHGADCWYRNIKLLPLARPTNGISAGRLWNLDELRKPPELHWIDHSGPLRKLVYTSEPRRGRPTRVFAWCGFPEKVAGKAPGIVLIHGGGGTAFPEWAALWAKRGYVAIAMDLAGKGPDGQPLPDGGPDQTDAEKFPVEAAPLEELWSYHAVAAAIRAGSVLECLPEVDAERLAVTGISWGGYLTCIVAGLDDRFKAAVPVYGCGFLYEESAWLSRFAALEPQWRQVWIEHFDPSRHVGRAKMPVLFVNGTNDFAYPLGSYRKTVRLVKDHALCVTVNMPHGHPQGWAPAEIGLFVDQHLRGAEGLPTLNSQPRVACDGQSVWATYNSARPARGQFHWTAALGPWQKRAWQSREARAVDGALVAELPADRPLAGFLTLTDDRGATVSTEHFILP
jgi:dienelactone hydrolase